MKPTFNKVFIATSLDGFIADKHGKIDFLYTFPDPVDDDMGYHDFMSSVDAILMGRKTYETVIGFGIEWPYKIPVFVWSSTLNAIPAELQEKVQIVSGSIEEILEAIHQQGHDALYIDGGQTIQTFLQHDLIDEMIITTIPILLGNGIRLFGSLPNPLVFNCMESKVFSNKTGQFRYIRSK